MKILGKNYSIFITLTMLFVSACLPVQKETQCGNNEAFNATQRKCVPVIGSASTNTVFVKTKTPVNSYTLTLGDNPVQHSVSVSDVYNFGYSTVWNIRFTSSVSSIFNFSSDGVANNVLTYSFLPPTEATPSLAGSYVIECVILDQNGGTQLDSVSWTVQVGAQATPTITNRTPNIPSISVFSTSTSEAFSADISNPDGQSGIYTWYVNDVAVTTPATFIGGSTIPTSITVDPLNDGLGEGLHTVELVVTQFSDPSVIFDSYTWVLNVVDPALATISSASPGFDNTLIAINGVSYSSNGYYDSSFNSIFGTGICFTLDEADADKDGDGNYDLDYSLLINGTNITGQLPYDTQTKCVTTALPALTLVSDQVGEARTVTLRTFKAGTSTVVEERQWAMTVIPKNSSPVISIRANSEHSSCLGLVDEALSVTGCSVIQSADDDGDSSYNTASSDDVDNNFTIVINVKDFESYAVTPSSDPFGEDDMEVIFQIKKSTDASYQDLDGTSILSLDNCYQGTSTAKTAGSGTPSAGYDTTYICDFGVNAFNPVTQEPLEAGSYDLKAFVRDSGSIFAPSNIQESNQVTWSIEVTELQSQALIQAQANTGTGSTTASWVERADASCNGLGTEVTETSSVDENDNIIVHTIVKDVERDNIQYSIRMENGVSGGDSFVVPLTDSSATYSAGAQGYIDIESACFSIPEWVVKGSDNLTKDINVFIDINEYTDAGFASSDSETLVIEVNNDNPIPVFGDASDVALSPASGSLTAGSDIIVYSGYPFEVDPPSYSDASSVDGAIVSWQWQYCIGACTSNLNYTAGNTNPVGSWVSISNANDVGSPGNENIIWTPNPRIAAGTNVNLRICLGDDGGNPSDCSAAATSPGSFKVYQNIKAFPAQVRADGYSVRELATWYDVTDDTLYQATTSGTQIRVAKFQRTTTPGSKVMEQIHEITFNSEIPTKTSDVPTQLSMTGINNGTNGSLFISYKVTDQSTGAPQLRVRRIDISNDKLSFHYGGLYNNDTEDLVSNLPVSATTFNVTGNAQLIVDFSGWGGSLPVTTESFDIITTSDGSTAETVQYCNPSCATVAAATASLTAAITGNANLNQELFVVDTGSTVEIYGPPRLDYADFGGISVNIGQIVINEGQERWYVPYAGTSSLNIYYSGQALSDMTTTVPSNQPVAGAGTVNQEVANAVDSAGNVIVASKGSSGNLDVYRVNGTSFALNGSASNVFTFTGSEEIYGISVGVGVNDDIYIACINQNNVTGLEYLSAAFFDGANLAQNNSTTTFTTSNYLAQPGIEEVKIIGHPSEDGVAILGVTTNSDHRETSASADGSGIPRQAHLFRLFNGDTTNFTAPPTLGSYNSSTTNLTSPALNVEPVVDLNSNQLGSISMVPGFDYATSPYTDTIGHENDSSTPATEDSAEITVWFSFHESDTGAPNGTYIYHGQYNINAENISTDASSVDDSQDGNFPSFVEN